MDDYEIELMLDYVLSEADPYFKLDEDNQVTSRSLSSELLRLVDG
jgi:hypothetical protein